MGKQNFITIQLMAISGILISILVVVVSFRQFSLPQSQADLSTEVGLQLPYLRLEQLTQTLVDGKKVVEVEVLANTGGSKVIGVDFVVDYDPQILRIVDVQTSGALGVVNADTSVEGVLRGSVFSSLNRDEPIVQTNADQEIPVAIIYLEVVNNTDSISQLILRKSQAGLDDSNLILLEDPRPEFPTDILQDVRGVILSI